MQKKRKPIGLLASSLFLRTLARIPCSNHLFAICIALLKITEPEYTHLPTQLLVAPIPIPVAAATSRPASTPPTTATTTIHPPPPLLKARAPRPHAEPPDTPSPYLLYT